MSEPAIIDGLSDLAGDYDAMLCDAWGVIHNGVDLFPGVARAMARFRQTRGPVVILTNAPRPASIIPPQLDRLGLPRDCWNVVVTAGDAARREIEKLSPAPAYRIGPPKDDALFDGLEIDFAPLERAGFLICTGLVDDHADEPEDYRPLLAQAVERGLPMVCANPDVVVNWGGRMIWCAGALAAIYEELGGDVAYGGKPYPPIYDLARDAVMRAAGADKKDLRILAVGDGLGTDIKGANAVGVDALLVVGEGGLNDGAGAADAINRLREQSLSVVAIMDGLKW